ncbi:YecR family lipoprotein [Enterobacter ludwigii]
MRNNILVLLVSTLVLSGCATQKQMVPMGGSKADGTVRMGFDYGLFEKPVLDKNQAIAAAEQRCKAWGYSGTEPFGGATQTCNQPSSSGCMGWHVETEFQCTGEIKK